MSRTTKLAVWQIFLQTWTLSFVTFNIYHTLPFFSVLHLSLSLSKHNANVLLNFFSHTPAYQNFQLLNLYSIFPFFPILNNSFKKDEANVLHFFILLVNYTRTQSVDFKPMSSPFNLLIREKVPFELKLIGVLLEFFSTNSTYQNFSLLTLLHTVFSIRPHS